MALMEDERLILRWLSLVLSFAAQIGLYLHYITNHISGQFESLKRSFRLRMFVRILQLKTVLLYVILSSKE